MIAHEVEDKMKINDGNFKIDNNYIEFKITKYCAKYCAGLGVCLLFAASLLGSCRDHLKNDRRRLLGISDEKYATVRSVQELQNPALLEDKVMNSSVYSRPDFIVEFKDGSKKVYVHRGFDEYDVIKTEKDVLHLRSAHSDN